MSRRSNGRTRLKASLFSRQKQVLSFKVLKGISLVGTCAHPRDIHGSKIGIYLGISQVYVMDIPVPPGTFPHQYSMFHTSADLLFFYLSPILTIFCWFILTLLNSHLASPDVAYSYIFPSYFYCTCQSFSTLAARISVCQSLPTHTPHQL